MLRTGTTGAEACDATMCYPAKVRTAPAVLVQGGDGYLACLGRQAASSATRSRRASRRVRPPGAHVALDRERSLIGRLVGYLYRERIERPGGTLHHRVGARAVEARDGGDVAVSQIETLSGGRAVSS